MVEFNRKKQHKKLMYSPFTLLILFIALLVMMKAVWGVYDKEKMSAANLSQEQAEYNKMMERKKELANSVEFLKTDQGIESEIRSKFRVVKEGEQVVVIVGDDAPDEATSTPTSTPNFWQRLFGF